MTEEDDPPVVAAIIGRMSSRPEDLTVADLLEMNQNLTEEVSTLREESEHLGCSIVDAHREISRLMKWCDLLVGYSDPKEARADLEFLTVKKFVETAKRETQESTDALALLSAAGIRTENGLVAAVRELIAR